MNVNNSDILAALSEVYISIFEFDINEDVLIPYKSNKYIDMWSAGFEGIQAPTNNVMKKITVPDQVDMMLEFVDVSTMKNRLRDRNDISIIFQGKINGWSRARLIVMERDEVGDVSKVIYAVECVDEEKRRENHLLYLSQTDLMTGISNRGYGEKCIADMLKNGTSGMFCIMDIDRFKMVNDVYGHDVGDRVLVEFADALKKVKRDQDIIMRLGGDEFAAFFEGVSTEQEAKNIIAVFFDNVSKVKIGNMDEGISVSLGALFCDEPMDFDHAYKSTDRAVYNSKNCKGSSYKFATI